MENTDYYLYSPDSPQFENSAAQFTNEKGDPEVEEILRTNPEVWETYQTGRFRVVTRTEDGHKKIILKEKARDDIDDSEFVVRRFKVFVTTPRNSRVRDDHVLLVSFSQKSLPTNQQQQQTNPAQYHHRLEIEPSLRSPASNQNLIPYTHTNSSSQIMTGPGTDLINKIVNGEEDSFEMLDDGHYESAYEIQNSPSKQSGDNCLYEKTNTTTTESSTRSSQSQGSGASSSGVTDQEDYIDEIINKIKNQVSQRDEELGSESRGGSQSGVSRSMYSAGTHHARNNTPFVSNEVSSATPVSVSYGSRYINDGSNVHANGSVIHYNDGQEFRAEDSFGHVSRSSTRNASAHEQHDTHSIGPGSMAGGSLFGGYIPNHVEHGVIEKSAFSEYNLTKNEDGDYVLREANGKSEMFDGKSGFSMGARSNESRSQISRLEENSRG